MLFVVSVLFLLFCCFVEGGGGGYSFGYDVMDILLISNKINADQTLIGSNRKPSAYVVLVVKSNFTVPVLPVTSLYLATQLELANKRHLTENI